MFISIEGNIGAGKSTLLAHLKSLGGEMGGRRIVFVPEPVHLWEEIRDEAGANMIQLFYGDQTRHSFAFQVMAFVSRYKLLESAILDNPGAIIIAERGLEADCIFASMLFASGKMSLAEHTIYMHMFECFNRLPTQGVIYLRCAPETALARCKTRNRLGEVIPLEYLQECHARHENWLKDTNALILDAEQEATSHISLIEEFIRTL